MRCYKSNNRHKFLLQYHIIFACKYRKKLFLSICKNNYSLLKKYYWKEKIFWTDGYFVSSIMDASWNILINQLKYKSKWYGRKYITVDKFYTSSQICSNCGYKNSNTKNLSIRVWFCPNCNMHHNRDVNASINISQQGLQLA